MGAEQLSVRDRLLDERGRRAPGARRREVDAIVGQHGVDPVGHRFDQPLEEVAGRALFGFAMSYPLAPLVLAMVLGHKAEDAFHQSMVLSDGSLDIFFSNTLVTSIMLVAIGMLIVPRLVQVGLRLCSNKNIAN
ncbi:Uncharacterised protein [Starkeya nomas]|uniref:Uncharacterized protein n=1 Tax=Starkeya nomas TaxID=2666134 RepID=A0A5S9NJG2_9HYPH|nr:Uncharacterised protein [Starkeya nomas]